MENWYHMIMDDTLNGTDNFLKKISTTKITKFGRQTLEPWELDRHCGRSLNYRPDQIQEKTEE